MKKQTQEEYEKKVTDIYGDKFSIIGKYINAKTDIDIMHNQCGWVFKKTPYHVLTGKCKCPVCDPEAKNITASAFQQKVRNKAGNDYIVLGEYVNMHTPILMRHNNCSCSDGFSEFSICPSDFLYGKGICPVERHKGTKLSISDIQKRIGTFNKGYVLLSESYDDPKQLLSIKCNLGHIYTTTIDSISIGGSCPICSNKRVEVGINDYWTTHPERAKYLKDPKDGYSFTYGTSKKQLFVCQFCKKEYLKKPVDAFSDTGRFICECNDGISYPEKFMLSLLKQLEEPYIYQLSKSNFEWCGKYRYDFYLLNRRAIIEINGLQHYNQSSWHVDYEKIKENDECKMNLALKNGYNYIVIDARLSDFNVLKSNIMNSELSSILDLSCVNWTECNTEANNSLYILTAKLWSDGVHSVQKIAKELGISDVTTMKYLDNAGKSGLCDFDREKHRKEVNHGHRRVPVECIETGEIFSSFSDVKKKIRNYSYS